MKKIILFTISLFLSVNLFAESIIDSFEIRSIKIPINSKPNARLIDRPKEVVLFDSDKKELWSYKWEKPEEIVLSVTISKNGKRIACATIDLIPESSHPDTGYLYYFDNKRKLIWKKKSTLDLIDISDDGNLIICSGIRSAHAGASSTRLYNGKGKLLFDFPNKYGYPAIAPNGTFAIINEIEVVDISGKTLWEQHHEVKKLIGYRYDDYGFALKPNISANCNYIVLVSIKELDTEDDVMSPPRSKIRYKVGVYDKEGELLLSKESSSNFESEFSKDDIYLTLRSNNKVEVYHLNNKEIILQDSE